jgi:hypothetical protein
VDYAVADAPQKGAQITPPTLEGLMSKDGIGLVAVVGTSRWIKVNWTGSPSRFDRYVTAIGETLVDRIKALEA